MRIRRWWTNAISAVILLLLPSAARAEQNYCLPASDVAAVLGQPVSQSGDRVPSGPRELLTQDCKYETKPFTNKSFLNMSVSVALSASDAAKIFALEKASFGSMMGPSQPVSGFGDEAILYTAGCLWIRKKNLCLSFDLILSDFSGEKKVKLLKLLATKVLSGIHS